DLVSERYEEYANRYHDNDDVQLRLAASIIQHAPGHVAAFRKVAERLTEIERKWKRGPAGFEPDWQLQLSLSFSLAGALKHTGPSEDAKQHLERTFDLLDKSDFPDDAKTAIAAELRKLRAAA